MKIVISGAGRVGCTLTGFLTNEGHDITVIDKNGQLVDEVVNRYDVLGIVGNGASVDVQKEAGVDKCDFFISVATTDEGNIMSCTVARALGAKHTVSRVRNPDYYTQADFMKANLGIGMISNPELEAAFEIERIIRFPAALKVQRFSGRKVEMIELKINPDNPLIGVSLWEFRQKIGINIIVCAVQRGDEVIIPDGNYAFKEGDKIHVTGSHEELLSLMRAIKLQQKKIKSVMLIGGGDIAYYLARRLIKLGISTRIIEQNRDRCDYLAGELPKARIIHGDGTDTELLTDEDIDNVDACVALTGNDEENILVSIFGSTRNVDKTISKVNRMSFIEMIPKLGFDGSLVSPVNATALHILAHVRATENAMGSSLNTLYKIVDNKTEVIEFTATDGFEGADTTLMELKLKSGLIVAGIIRNDELILPVGSSVIKPGDRVIIVTTNEGIGDLNDILA